MRLGQQVRKDFYCVLRVLAQVFEDQVEARYQEERDGRSEGDAEGERDR